MTFRQLPLIILLIILAPVFSFSGQDADEETVGLNRFNIINIQPGGKISNAEFIDFNKDGLKDIFLTCFIEDKNPANSYQQGFIFLQKEKKGFTNIPDLSWKLDPKATVLLLGNFMPVVGIEIGYLTKEGLFAYYFPQLKNPDASSAAKENQIASQKLLDTSSIFISPQNYDLPVWQKPIDLDNNGYDDIVLPKSGAYQIYFQEPPGGKFVPCTIEIHSEKKLEHTSSSFITIKDSLPNILIEDINTDGLKDITLFNKGELFYYLQEKNNRLDQRFPITSSGKVSIKPLQKELKPNEISHATLQLSDINQDGLFDLLISIMQGGIDEISSLRTQILFFLGQKGEAGKDILCYAESPNQIINLKGIVPLVAFNDVNEDGKADLISASFQMDFSSNLQKAILRYLKLTYQIQTYQNKTQQFVFNPDYERTLNFPLELIGKGRKYFSHIYFRDFNGDNRPDVLTISGPDKDHGKVNIRLARNPKELSSPQVVSFYRDEYLLYPAEIPSEVKVLDLNSDRKNDIVLEYRSRITVIISK